MWKATFQIVVLSSAKIWESQESQWKSIEN